MMPRHLNCDISSFTMQDRSLFIPLISDPNKIPQGFDQFMSDLDDLIASHPEKTSELRFITLAFSNHPELYRAILEQEPELALDYLGVAESEAAQNDPLRECRGLNLLMIKTGKTPILNKTTHEQRLACIAVLLQYGADPFAVNADANTNAVAEQIKSVYRSIQEIDRVRFLQRSEHRNTLMLSHHVLHSLVKDRAGIDWEKIQLFADTLLRSLANRPEEDRKAFTILHDFIQKGAIYNKNLRQRLLRFSLASALPPELNKNISACLRPKFGI